MSASFTGLQVRRWCGWVWVGWGGCRPSGGRLPSDGEHPCSGRDEIVALLCLEGRPEEHRPDCEEHSADLHDVRGGGDQGRGWGQQGGRKLGGAEMSEGLAEPSRAL